MGFTRNIGVSIAIVVASVRMAIADPWLYVLNGNAETLSRIDVATGTIQNHVLTTGPVPNEVAFYQGRLYVVNSGSAGLQVIDLDPLRTLVEVPLPVNTNPLNVAFWGNYAFVSGFFSSKVYQVDLRSFAVVDSFAVGVAPAGMVVVGSILVVANTGFDRVNFTFGQGTITVIEITRHQRLADIPVGKNPQALLLGPDGLINVICTGDYFATRGKIYFINLSALSVVDSLATGGDPFWPIIGPNGLVFVSAGGWAQAGYVFCYDPHSRNLIRGAANPIQVPLGAMGLTVDSAGVLYCAAQMANVVCKFNLQGQVLANYPVGSGPVSVTVAAGRTDVADLDRPTVPIDLGLPFPNPSNQQVVLPLEGSSLLGAGVVVEIYDVQGRLVTDIYGTTPGYLIWRGTDKSGAPIASGVYFARLRGGARLVKMVMLR